MTETRQAVAFNAITTGLTELKITTDAFEEAMLLIQQIASGELPAAAASAFLMEMERRKLARPGYYDAQQRLRDILKRSDAPGRYTEVGWENIHVFRVLLTDIVEQNPEKTKQAIAKPGLRRWFLGQMLARSTTANLHVKEVTDLIETVFKEASR